MALQVWLPFTDGTLKQQGLSSSTVTQTGTINLTNTGKLGKCATFTTTAGRLNLPTSVMTSFAECSVTLWLNVTAWNTGWDTIFQAGLGSTAWNNYIFGILRNNNSTLACTISNGSTTSSGSYVSSTLSTGTWIHLAFTYSTGKIKIYINGTLDKEYSTSIVPNFAGITYITIGNTNSNSYQCNCKMNDFRIYDHCLSPMEVKELAKGLVLHYPLNRQGWGQENLLRGSNVIGSGTTIYGWVSNGSATNMEILSDGSLHYKYNISNSKYIPSITTNTVVPCEFSKTYFYSMDLKFDKAITLGTSVPAHFWVGARNSNSITNTSCNGNLTGIQTQYISNHSGTLPANTWVHITTKFTFPAAATSSGYNYPAIRCFVYGSVLTETITGEVNVWMKNCKVEEGSIATPWCPNSADALATTMGLNSITEYDCSGFCNNGTRTGTFSWTSDTPKYEVSTQFTGSQIIRLPFTCGTISEAVSVAVWGHESNWNTSSAERLIGAATSSSGWCVGDYGSENTLFAFYANGSYNTATGFKQLSAGWHHFVITFDGLNLIYYVDGQEFSKKTFTTKQTATGNYNIEIGRHYGDGYNFKGCMSDVRIYATALSATDVKSLYQNCATIDPDGTIRGQIRS